MWNFRNYQISCVCDTLHRRRVATVINSFSLSPFLISIHRALKWIKQTKNNREKTAEKRFFESDLNKKCVFSVVVALSCNILWSLFNGHSRNLNFIFLKPNTPTQSPPFHDIKINLIFLSNGFQFLIAQFDENFYGSLD